MGLFDLPKRATDKEAIKKKASRAQYKKDKSKNMRINTGGSGTDLMSKIKMIKDLVLSRIKPDKLKLIRTEAELVEYMDNVQKNGIAAIDTETTGLNPMEDEIVGICIYTKGEKAAYIPINHISYITGARVPDQLDKKFVLDQFNRLKEIKWILHNAKFDVRFLRHSLGIYIKPYWDTQIASYLLNENEPHRLKYLYEKYIARDESGLEDSFNALFKGVTFNLIPIETAYLYAAKDALITYELYEFQDQFLNPEMEQCKEKGLEDTGRLFLNIEMPLIVPLADMEDQGISIDLDHAAALSEEYHKKLESEKTEIYGILTMYRDHIDKLPMELRGKLSDPINLNSPAQLSIILYDVMKVGVIDRRNPRGTGADILQSINNKFTKALLNYRGTEKLLGTYIDKIPNEINEKTGKVHGRFNQDKTVTGRFSSDGPNLQNIPSRNKEIRKMFIADPGKVFIGGDYSQQEPRALAHMSGDGELIKAYTAGRDIYATMAAKVYNIDYGECLEFREDGSTNPAGKKRRSNMKSVVLGIMYGRGAASIAEQIGEDRKAAEKIISDFYKAFPKVAKFTKDVQAHARHFGFVKTAWGRKRRLPDINLPPFEFGEDVPENTRTQYTRRLLNLWGDEKKAEIAKARAMGIHIKDNTGFIAQAERQCLNSVIQGTSADITKKAMLDLYKSDKLRNLGFTMVLTVHDEIIGMAPEENAKEAAKIMDEIMMAAAAEKISVPMSVDIEIIKRWYGEPVA